MITDVVMIFITLCVIAGVSMLFFVFTKVTAEEAWASAIMSVILFIFFTGLFGSTKLGLYAVYGASALGFISAVIFSVKEKKNVLFRFFTPAVLMVFALTIFVTLCFRGLMVSNYDELYQWGKAVHYMLANDTLTMGADYSGDALLLSTTTVFHYFTAKLGAIVSGFPIESDFYVSNVLLWFSAVILPLSGITWKEKNRVFAFGIFNFVLAALIFKQPYYNIYTDQATAYWSGALIAWFFLRKNQKNNIYLIPLILINVGMMKSMEGPLFAVIAILAAVVIWIADKRENSESLLIKDMGKLILSKKGLFGALIALSPLILVVVWSKIVGRNGIFRGSLTIEGDFKVRLLKTVKAMIGMLFESVTLKEKYFHLTYLIFILITITLVYIIYPKVVDKKDQMRYKSLMLIYLIGFFGYFLIMLFTYMTVFPYEDSIEAISLYRYYSDYMMLGVLPLAYPMFLATESEGNEKIVMFKRCAFMFSVIGILASCGYYIPRNLVHMYAVEDETYGERENFKSYKKQIDKLTGGEGKIYFINQKEKDIFTLVADYDFGDRISRGGMCFLFRPEYDGRVNALTEYPIDELPYILSEQGYSYLWVYSKNKYLSMNFEEIFGEKDLKNGSFFKVIPGENGADLKPMGRIVAK